VTVNLQTLGYSIFYTISPFIVFFPLFTLLCSCLPTYQSTNLPTYLPTYLPTCLSVCLSVCLAGWLAGWLAVCLSVCLSVYLSIYLSIYLSFFLSFFLRSNFQFCCPSFLSAVTSRTVSLPFNVTRLIKTPRKGCDTINMLCVYKTTQRQTGASSYLERNLDS
jgi:hypothetical protein